MDEKLIKELKQIRIRLTQIYMKLVTPKQYGADMVLGDDIVYFEFEEKSMTNSQDESKEKK